MSPSRRSSKLTKGRTESTTGTTRRRFLAAGAGAALGGMAGCLGQVAGRMTDTSASPAAMIPAMLTGGGVEQLQSGFRSPGSRVFDVTDLRAQSVPASIKSSGVLSASLELDGWSVDAIQPANDYNSVRSNKRRSAVGITPDDTDEDDDGFDELREALYAYLESEGVAGETVAVSLPDANIPRGPAIADEITPGRILQYMTSDQLCVERDGELYCWGNNSFESASDDDSDVLAWSWGANRADLLVPEHSGRSVVAISRGSSVVVTVQNDPPEAGRGSGSGMVSIQSVGRGTDDQGGFVPDYQYDSTASYGWGEESESGGVTATPVIVAPALALPEGAPMPIPAVAYVRRCKHEGEYIYTGGWVIDDGVLYEDSCTLLTLQGPNEVVSFTPENVASTDAQQALAQRVRRATRHRRRGASLHRGNVDEGLLDALPEEFREGEGRRELVSLVEETLQQKNSGRNPQTGKEIRIPLRDGAASNDHDVMSGVAVALDCPLVHLVDADDDQKAEAARMYLKIASVEEENDAHREEV